MGAVTIHGFDRQPHAESGGVVREEVQVFRRAEEFILEWTATAQSSGMAVKCPTVCRRTQFGCLGDYFLVPIHAQPAVACIIVGNVTVHRPEIAGADRQLDTKRFRMSPHTPAIEL